MLSFALGITDIVRTYSTVRRDGIQGRGFVSRGDGASHCVNGWCKKVNGWCKRGIAVLRRGPGRV